MNSRSICSTIASYKKLNKLIYNLMMASDQHPKYFKDGKQNSEKSKSFTN
jgi:hypothetical protein